MANEPVVVPREEPRHEEQDVLVTFALATFNVTVLLVAVLLLAYRRDPELGERLGDLGTTAGLGLFALLWVAAVWATRGALRRLPHPLAMPVGRTLAQGMRWGGRAGVLVFLALEFAVVVNGLATSAGTESASDAITGLALLVLYLAAVTAFGSAVAFVVGAAVGAAFALLDFAVLLAVRRALPQRP